MGIEEKAAIIPADIKKLLRFINQAHTQKGRDYAIDRNQRNRFVRITFARYLAHHTTGTQLRG
jgi:hypothetical protein